MKLIGIQGVIIAFANNLKKRYRPDFLLEAVNGANTIVEKMSIPQKIIPNCTNSVLKCPPTWRVKT